MSNTLMVKFNMRDGGQLEKKPFKSTTLCYVIQGNFGLMILKKNLLYVLLFVYFLLVPFIYSGDSLKDLSLSEMSCSLSHSYTPS